MSRIYIDDEDIIGNAMYDLFNYTGKREINSDTVKKYREQLFETLKDMNIDFYWESSREKWNDFKYYNNCFNINDNDNGYGYNITMKENIDGDKLSYYRAYIPLDLAIAFCNDKTKEALGITKKDKENKKVLKKVK